MTNETENRESYGDLIARVAELERKVVRLTEMCAHVAQAGLCLAAGGKEAEARLDRLEMRR